MSLLLTYRGLKLVLIREEGDEDGFNNELWRTHFAWTSYCTVPLNCAPVSVQLFVTVQLIPASVEDWFYTSLTG